MTIHSVVTPHYFVFYLIFYFHHLIYFFILVLSTRIQAGNGYYKQTGGVGGSFTEKVMDRRGGRAWGNHRTAQSPGLRNHEGHEHPWAWSRHATYRRNRFVFREPSGRSCDLQKLIWPSCKDSRERKLGKTCPRVRPPWPADLQWQLLFAKLNKKKRARNPWMKARDWHLFSVNDQIVNVSSFPSRRVSLATPQLCYFGAESSHS